jgi:hypothetical protein
MNREDIIRMMREAGLVRTKYAPTFHRLCEIAAAAEREAIKWNSIHSCHADCQNPACVIVREAVAAEREQCALTCEQAGIDGMGTLAAAAAIRARGQK